MPLSRLVLFWFSLGGRADPVSRTIKVCGEIRGDAAGLMTGMSGRANIPLPK
jgi:hypothetical protein